MSNFKKIHVLCLYFNVHSYKKKETFYDIQLYLYLQYGYESVNVSVVSNYVHPLMHFCNAMLASLRIVYFPSISLFVAIKARGSSLSISFAILSIRS
jgi:hypothetical protein